MLNCFVVAKEIEISGADEYADIEVWDMILYFNGLL